MKRFLLICFLLLVPIPLVAQSAQVVCPPATDPDGDALTAKWLALTGVDFTPATGGTTTMTRTDITVGSYQVSCVWDDGNGGTVQLVAALLEVTEAPPPPANNPPVADGPSDPPTILWEIPPAGGPGPPDPILPPPGNGWTECAEEGVFCSFTGTQLVAYGLSPDFAPYLELTDGTECTNAIFGDPAFGFLKHCYIRDPGGSTSPDPTPIPPIGGGVVRPAPITDRVENPGVGIDIPFYQLTMPPGQPDPAIDFYQTDWVNYEPSDNDFAAGIAYMEQALATADSRGRKAAFRVIPTPGFEAIFFNGQSGSAAVGQWLADKVGGTMYSSEGGGCCVFWPNINSPAFLTEVTELMSALGAAFDGDPRLAYWDMSFFGCWGEQNGACAQFGDGQIANADWPTLETYQAIIQAQRNAFPSHPLVVLGTPAGPRGHGALGGDWGYLDHAMSLGLGWRVDCFGDYGNIVGFNFMDVLYQPIVDRYPNAWHRGQVSFEICSSIAAWEASNVDFDRIMDQALRWHATTIHTKAGNIPGQWMPKWLDTLKFMGYRFRIAELEHLAEVTGSMDVRIDWVNEGVAPPYHDYIPAVSLVSTTGGPSLTAESTTEDVKTWLPGTHSMLISVPVSSLAPGDYTVRVALVSPEDGQPVITLANEGQDAEGWSRVSTVTVLGN